MFRPEPEPPGHGRRTRRVRIASETGRPGPPGRAPTARNGPLSRSLRLRLPDIPLAVSRARALLKSENKTQFLKFLLSKMEPKLKRCRACGKCSEQMDKCPICKTQFKLRWFDFPLPISDHCFPFRYRFPVQLQPSRLRIFATRHIKTSRKTLHSKH